MFLIAVIFAHIAGSDPGSVGSAPEQTVSVTLFGDTGLTQKLAVEIENAVRSDPRYIITSEPRGADLTISSDEIVQAHDLGGRSVVVYDVMLRNSQERGFKKVGLCYLKNLKICAKDIVFSLSNVPRSSGK